MTCYGIRASGFAQKVRFAQKVSKQKVRTAMAEIIEVTELPEGAFDHKEPRTYKFPDGSSITVGCSGGHFQQETDAEFEARLQAESEEMDAIFESSPEMKAAFERECALEPDALKRWLS